MARSMCRVVAAAAGCLLSIAAATLAFGAQRAPENSPGGGVKVAAGEFGSSFVALGIGKSIVVDLPGDVKDVLVADPKIANAVIRTSRRAYLIGVSVGQTNIFFFDAQGRQLAGFDIAVTRDLNGMRGALRQMFPGGNVRVEPIADGVMLTGSVATPVESQQAFDVAARLVGDSNKVVNSIVVRGRDQVMLKVTVAEMDRNVIKQLGINLNGSVGMGTSVVNFNNNNSFPVNGGLSSINPFAVNGSTLLGNGMYPPQAACAINPCLLTPPNSPPGISGTFKSVTANLQAMEQAGVARTLAEPNLTAISGESAHFLAGGMFPYPSITSCTTTPCPPVIQFQNFGVSLKFTPVVLSNGRISLNLLTEVSELNPANSVTVSGTTVPGLSVRRADTTVEIPSGGSLAMAGMIEQQTKQTISGIPGADQMPILGTLFRSRDYLNNETELVVIVTPYIVRPVAQKDLAQPDDGFADSPDPSAILLGRLNRLYGNTAAPGTGTPPRTSNGNFGFILD
jgi:pilus assembly protein CpaC